MRRQFTLFRMFAVVSWLTLLGFIALNYEVELEVSHTPPYRRIDFFDDRSVYFRFERARTIDETRLLEEELKEWWGNDIEFCELEF